MLNEYTKMSALIVDDHPLACMAIKSLLEKEKITVLAEAGDGVEALGLVNILKPDIITIDVDMPGMSGIEMVEILRKQKYAGIIIVVSAENDRFYSKRSSDAGANAFISKKEGMENIAYAVQAATNGYSYFPFILNGFVGSISSEQQMMETLSAQELKVMRYILSGVDNKDIANTMNLSSKTISTYKSRLMEKLECKTIMDLLAFANRNQIS